ncbi:MAG: glycogen debranching enzyme N-terminal domain-containing protein [Lentisphaeria bacterium]|nr:glycogen debranching enzyme N-terminal domain-containing protein [Lentisphaeria bacterium]
MKLKQFQNPDIRIFHRGDTVTYSLELNRELSGKAFIRTTLGNGKIRRREQIDKIENNSPISGMAWHDYAMEKVAPKSYQITFSLLECGCFESKCFFIPEDDKLPIYWAEGENFFLKVESAYNKAGNSMYTAFVRQFVPVKSPSNFPSNLISDLDDAGYTVIPKSGTFRQLKKQVDYIIDEMKCNIIQLLPIHPTPTVYGRMGRFGSPFASTDYFAVDPALADFDTKASPMEQFSELLDHIHSRGCRIFLDLPVNHTGWASKLQAEHADCFVRSSDGTYVSPGAWGIVWEDLCKLDYSKKEMYFFMAKVFLFWCRHGVDGFRCDAGYMVPAEAWEYIVAKVREEYPDTVFMLEGLGGPVAVQRDLLRRADLDWAYSELFQNYEKYDIENYGRIMNQTAWNDGTLINFAETHDNDRLAKKGKIYSLMRCAVNSLLSHAGAFGFANGVEFLAQEKIDVHGNSDLNWGNPQNIVKELGRLNSILHIHKCFLPNSAINFIHQENSSALMFERISPDGSEKLLVLINLNCEYSSNFTCHRAIFGDFKRVIDLFKNRPLHFVEAGDCLKIELHAGEFAVLSDRKEYLNEIELYQNSRYFAVPAVKSQQAREMLLKTYSCFTESAVLPKDFNIAEAEKRFLHDPENFFAEVLNNDMLGVIHYSADTDCFREVICGLEKVIFLKSENSFFVELLDNKKLLDRCEAIQLDNGQFFAVLKLDKYQGTESRLLDIKISIFKRGVNSVKKLQGKILQMSEKSAKLANKFNFEREELTTSIISLLNNDYSTLSQMRGRWGELISKYDAILGANLSNQVPVDKINMLLRCRAWVVVNDFSQELNLHVQKSFRSSLDNVSEWFFDVPVGQGAMVRIIIRVSLASNGNAVKIEFFRHFDNDTSHLPPEIPVKIIVRPDVDDRVGHTVTKAYNGAETIFPASVKLLKNEGFLFGAAADHRLEMTVSKGFFVHQPEWKYMVNLPFEEYYGLESKTDIFSPGYFEFKLKGNENSTLYAIVKSADFPKEIKELAFPKITMDRSNDFDGNLRKAIRQFIVKRDNYHTIIAGYPWFLDWGRDSLIALRGVIDYGFLDEAKNILLQFAKFEKEGTIPNMIRGNDDSNRDTCDAPLWLFTALDDYIRAVGSDAIINELPDGKRSLKEILFSIADNYIKGTPNKIKCDIETFLVASPAHFTWMDTAHPAATPRQGYAVEIQALWYKALKFLGQYDEKYNKIAEVVKTSFEKYFFNRKADCFSDCLHIDQIGTPVSEAVADDHIRPNQLLAVTLGLVTDRKMALNILRNTEQLLVSGGIRSLADKAVEYKLPVHWHGRLLNNPDNPYYGRYNGPEDTDRKVAYHNGTAWGWMFPSYMEAMYLIGGEDCKKRALLWLLSGKKRLNTGVPGQLPEVLEGNYPHKNGGCLAQAWSITEFARVYKLLK